MTRKCGDCLIFASFSRLSHDVLSELTFSSLTGSLNDIKLLSWYRDVGQDGLLLLYFNETSELMLPSLTGTKPVMGTVFGEVDQDDMFILQSNAMSELMSSTLTGIKTAECLSGEKAKYFVYSCNKSVCSLPALVALANDL